VLDFPKIVFDVQFVMVCYLAEDANSSAVYRIIVISLSGGYSVGALSRDK